MAEITQVADPYVLHLDDEGDVFPALRSPFAVVMSADPGQERAVYFVLPWTVEDHRMTGYRLHVAVVIVTMANGDDIGRRLADCVSSGRRARVGYYRRLAPAYAKTRVAQPDDLHGVSQPRSELNARSTVTT